MANKTDLVQYHYYPDASPYFAEDAVVDNDVRPKIRKGPFGKEKGDTLKLVLFGISV